MASRRWFAFGLRGKLFLAGVLLVAASTGAGVWSTLVFAHLSRVLAGALHDSEHTTEATATVASALEREDDALLLALDGNPTAAAELTSRRAAVDSAIAPLASLLAAAGERIQAGKLREAVAAYRVAGDAVVASGRVADAPDRYHREVNPLLRVAVGGVARIRDDHLTLIRRAAEFARDEAQRAVGIAAGVSLAALCLFGLLGLHLARGVVWPIRALTASVDALRRGDFEQRIPVRSRDEIGQLADGFNRMASDLAEFRRANMGEVLRAKQILEATLAALPDAVVIVDPEEAIVATNAAAQSILGNDAQARARLEALQVPAEVLDATREVLAGGRPSSRVDLHRAIPVLLGGEPMRFVPRVVPVDGFLSGRQGAVLVLNDVTDLIRLDEMRMELVAVASHELRTPLTTLRMTLLMLQEAAATLGPRQRELLVTALGGVEQLAATVDEFLDLTRIEAGQLRLACERVSVSGLVGEAERKLRGQCQDAGIVLGCVLDSELPLARLDPRRIDVVLRNVLSNSIKYTPDGGRIDLGLTGAAVDGGAVVRITVTDTGRGVPLELRERVFEKFFRVEHERTAEDDGVRGSGIGLYLAREIVEAHGGSIRCEAGDCGPGTRIVIELPIDGPRAEDFVNRHQA